jgi:hypothetical protein
MRADEAASLAIRPGKDGSLTPEVLRERWPAEVHGIGMPTSHVLEAQVCGGTIPMLRPRLEWDDLIDTLIEPEEGSPRRTSSSTSPPSAPDVSPSRPSKTWPKRSSTPSAPCPG